MQRYEQEYWDKNLSIIGLDEVGRGCVAGPMVVAGVIFPINYENNKIKDSKKLTAKQREELFEIIKKDALEVVYVFMSEEEIFNLNPKKASKTGMERCLDLIKSDVDLVMTDFEKIDTEKEQINLVKGDQKSISIAAASIIAKVVRDQYMDNLSSKHPEFGWDRNKGYLTKEHFNAIFAYGITDFHRKNFEPIKSILTTKNNSIN
ncbi:hypothetical protein VO56_03110 [Mycoplasmopsis gallinacea]|uniref:Ribonuclease n=1 Tax=Mycoplasmopsis gallinacea TaxID=29556 RepID=A0A0D5ZK84_9BACT|nr:hypothetical protein VO56_03110 [Mycoplasmopsis gallinacea]